MPYSARRWGAYVGQWGAHYDVLLRHPQHCPPPPATGLTVPSIISHIIPAFAGKPRQNHSRDYSSITCHSCVRLIKSPLDSCTTVPLTPLAAPPAAQRLARLGRFWSFGERLAIPHCSALFRRVRPSSSAVSAWRTPQLRFRFVKTTIHTQHPPRTPHAAFFLTPLRARKRAVQSRPWTHLCPPQRACCASRR